MSMADRSEGAMTALVEVVCHSLVDGEEVKWEELSLFQQYKIKDQVLPVLTACIKAVDEEPHKAKRDSDIEAWIRRRRDEHRHGSSDEAEWDALDELLADYRLHADTGTPLSSDVDEMGG